MPRNKQFDQENVLKKAMELFWKKGYHATSIQQLVEHLGINRASLYDTYGGKQELFLKSFRLYIESNTRGFSNFLNSHEDVKQGIRLLFQTALQDSAIDEDNKGCFVVNTTTELVPGDDEVQNILVRNRENFEQLFLQYLQKGVEAGQLPANKDYQSLAGFLFTLYNGLKVISKVNDNQEQLQKSINLALALLD